MGLIALAVWSLTCARELQVALDILRAILALPRGTRTRMAVDRAGGLRFLALGPARICGAVAVQAVLCECY